MSLARGQFRELKPYGHPIDRRSPASDIRHEPGKTITRSSLQVDRQTIACLNTGLLLHGGYRRRLDSYHHDRRAALLR
jgi:hypothetical protein